MTTTEGTQTMSIDPGYSGNATQGAEYDSNRYVTAAEIARNTRGKIKAAVAAGELPGKDQGFKYSVRSETFAGGQAVRIHVIGPGDDDTAWAFRDVTPDDWQAIDYGLTRTYTDDAKRIGRLVESFARAYTREDVDSMTDYFNVSCYVSAYCGSGGLCL